MKEQLTGDDRVWLELKPEYLDEIRKHANETLNHDLCFALAFYDALRADLAALDGLLARRPALADCKTRYDMVALALSTAAKADKCQRDLTAANERINDLEIAVKAARDQIAEDFYIAAGHILDAALQPRSEKEPT